MEKLIVKIFEFDNNYKQNKNLLLKALNILILDYDFSLLNPECSSKFLLLSFLKKQNKNYDNHPELILTEVEKNLINPFSKKVYKIFDLVFKSKKLL